MIEVILTIILISALVAVAAMFSKPLAANEMSKRYTVAANLAQQAIETLKVEDTYFWAAIDDKVDIDFACLSHRIETRKIVNGHEYTVSATVEPHNTVLGIIVVDIIVQYEQNKQVKSAHYITYFTKNKY